MKKLFFFMMIAVAAMGMSSCLNDDDDYDGLSLEEQHEAFTKVQGTYAGKLYYPIYDGTFTSKSDSADVSWTMTSDSVINIHGMKVSALSELIANDSLRNAFAALPDEDLKVNCLYITLDPVTFLLAPQYVYTYVTSEGKDPQEVRLYFYGYIGESYGMVNTTGQKMIMYLKPAAITVGGKEVSSLRYGYSQCVYCLSGTKQ